MQNFIVSARKYRPETFSAVVGQDAIATTLKNAIRNNHLGHAYLFCGPRGVGKTTCARIFAKTINCSAITDKVEPCNECESCISFNEMRAYNIHELDAASNNSVDDIRNLTEQVRIPPQIGKYSIYIIDEVHMLSAQAFNAFLKTLEEPPAHAVFILATTEKHKIIPTILSRCQIFDFNRIKVLDAVRYMKEIAKSEGVSCEDDALTMIAQKADGAMRDALSIFDQVVSFSRNTVSYEDVISNLNILDYEYYFNITDAILQQDASRALLILEDVLSRGFDGHNFLSGIGSHLRDLLVAQDTATLDLLDVGAGIRERYLQQSSVCPVEFLFKALDLANQADLSYKSSRNQRLHLELLLIKLAGHGSDKKKQLTSDSHPEKIKEKAAESPTTPDKENKADSSSLPDKEIISENSLETEQGGEEEQRAEESIQEESVEDIPAEIPDQAENPTKDETQEEKVTEDESPQENTTATTAKKYGESEKTQSIKDALNGNGKQKNEEKSRVYQLEERNAVFDSEKLNASWLGFAESISKEKPRMYTFLKNHPPVLKDEFQIEVSFHNSAQLAEFSAEIKQDLSEYMWNALDNNVFKIVPLLPEESDEGRKLYTQEDKYEHLKKKNPALAKLKQDFNLDLE